MVGICAVITLIFLGWRKARLADLFQPLWSIAYLDLNRSIVLKIALFTKVYN
jgi:hypothetical protein